MEIAIEGVGKRFGHRQVLEDISLPVATGELLGLLGPSGAGKTTLIRLVTGAIGCNAGQIHVGDRRMVADYSSGMRKRLSLAVTLLHEQPVLLLDEPTVGIDPVLRRTVWDLFADFSRQGRTLIVSTHVMDEAERCQKVALLYNGRLIAHDTVARLKAATTSGALEELFLQNGWQDGPPDDGFMNRQGGVSQ